MGFFKKLFGGSEIVVDPLDLQKLAGYTIGVHALGYLDDVRDAGASFGGSDRIRPSINRQHFAGARRPVVFARTR